MSMDDLATKQYKKALEDVASGDLAAARRALQDLLLKHPQHLDARNDLGAIYCNEGRPEIALIHFEVAMKGDGSNEVYRENFNAAKQVLDQMNRLAADELPVAQVNEEKLRQALPKRVDVEIPLELPRITLGIPTRNRVEPLLALLQSIQRQTFQNFELLISDDGDRFDIPAEIRRAFPNLEFRYIRGPQRNLPANRQNIMDASRTEFVMMCDDDHIMEPSCVEQLVRTIVADSNLGIVCAIWPNPAEGRREMDLSELVGVEEYRLDLDNIGAGSDFWWKNGTETFKCYTKEPQIIDSQVSGGGCLIYRKSAVELAGGFPNDMSVVSFREDTDMSHRVYLAGFRIVINTAAVALHMTASQGGCRDTRDWEENFVRDGLKFIERLRMWRTRASQLEQIRRHLPIKVALMYDEPGWAWWHRSHAIKRFIGEHCANIEIAQLNHSFKHDDFDFVFAFDYNVLVLAPPIPAHKLIIGNSCPKLIDGAIKMLDEGGCVAVVVNNLQTYAPFRHRSDVFLCQNGVDLDLFSPAEQPTAELVACWTGNSTSIGVKGLDLIEEACRREGVRLEVLDVAQKPSGVPAFGHEHVRDSLYRRASVYICASQWEGTPNPALEALACGIPVISTSVGNIPELITDGYNGFIAERSVDGLVEAIRKWKASDRIQMARNARRSVEDGWGWSAQVKKYEQMFLEVARKKFFSDLVVAPVTDEQVERARSERMPNATRMFSIEEFVERRDGRYAYLRPQLLSEVHDGEKMQRAFLLFSGIAGFYFHFGSPSDALLLLSKFYDHNPQQTIVSVGNPEEMRRFFDAFPLLREVYLIPMPERPDTAALSRMMTKLVPTCLGMGVTPEKGHVQEWVPNLNIVEKYDVNQRPNWAEAFRASREQPFQVVLAPKGSRNEQCLEDSARISVEMWPMLLRELMQRDIRPLILGSPEDRAAYPAIAGSIDRRDATFSEQMKLVASSDLVISAATWARTFAALLGIPTCVTGFHQNDVSANVFVRPWPGIAVTPSIDAVKPYLPTPASMVTA